MMDRRRFLGGVLGLTLGGRALFGTVPGSAAAGGLARPCLADDPVYRRYLADVAGCDMRVLGVPRRRSLVQEAFHPISPERVILLAPGDCRRFCRQHADLKRWLRGEEARWLSRCQGEPLPAVKLDLCVDLMARLTTHYGRSDLLGKWARMLFLREALGSTGIGHGFGLLHDFQTPDPVISTTNGIVDWWLVLVPGGIEWQALDDRPVHYLVGPVMEERQPGRYLRVMEGISRGLRCFVKPDDSDPASWAVRLAGMSPPDAAREVNFIVARGLARSPAGRARRLT